MAGKRSRRRGKGDGGLFKRADGMWVASIEIPSADGRRRQKRAYSRTYDGARDKLDVLRKELDDGVITSPKITVAKWLTYWLQEIKRPHVRPSTYDFYNEAVRLHIVPRIGDKRLDRLTPEHVRAMLRAIPTGRNRQRAHQTLGLALKQAVKDGMLRRNVCDAVEKPKHVATARGAFTVDDALVVMRKAIELEESRDATEPRLATRWVAAFMTGARQGELIGLELDRLDLDAGLMDLSWQLQQIDQVHGCGEAVDGKYPCGRARAGYCPNRRWDLPDGYESRKCHRSLLWTKPKTETGQRIVPIVEPLLTMLRQHVAATAGEPNPHGLVWHYPLRPRNPGGPIYDDHERWHQLLKAAGVPRKELHAARHTTATLLQQLGVPQEVRMQITGHSSAAAHAAYIHVDQTQTRAALDKLAELLPLTIDR